MGFDFLLVQPQVFIEKKKPHLSRYTCITPAETYCIGADPVISSALIMRSSIPT